MAAVVPQLARLIRVKQGRGGASTRKETMLKRKNSCASPLGRNYLNMWKIRIVQNWMAGGSARNRDFFLYLDVSYLFEAREITRKMDQV